MKAGVAIGLKLAVELSAPRYDMTWIFYDNEEVEAKKNGLGLLGASHPEWLTGDFALVGEPSHGAIEAGCNGTLRAEIVASGVRAHSARSWMGSNAIHSASEILGILQAYQPREVDVEGLVYKEGLNAVAISGGIAGNVIPDECIVTINYRFAPNRSLHEATNHIEELFSLVSKSEWSMLLLGRCQESRANWAQSLWNLWGLRSPQNMAGLMLRDLANGEFPRLILAQAIQALLTPMTKE